MILLSISYDIYVLLIHSNPPLLHSLSPSIHGGRAEDAHDAFVGREHEVSATHAALEAHPRTGLSSAVAGAHLEASLLAASLGQGDTHFLHILNGGDRGVWGGGVTCVK